MISSPVFPALMAGLATWGFTAAGAAFAFTPRACSRRTLDILLGFAAGVMLAASFWCLLSPALELAGTTWGRMDFVPVAASLAAGALLLDMLDRVLPHACIHRHEQETIREPGEPAFPRNILLFLAVTLHNIPEGLALGVAFGAALSSPETGGLAGAALLTCGICLHNLPVGMARGPASARRRLFPPQGFSHRPGPRPGGTRDHSNRRSRGGTGDVAPALCHEPCRRSHNLRRRVGSHSAGPWLGQWPGGKRRAHGGLCADDVP